MKRFFQIALYVAVMSGVAWAVSRISPNVVTWIEGGIGKNGMTALMIVFPFSCWGLAYFLNRRDSGRALDP